MDKKIIIDTDLGDDIDDAFALAMGIGMGMDIEGITTVFRNANNRAKLVQKFLFCDYGIDYIPIVSGISQPSHRIVDENSPQFKIIGNKKGEPRFEFKENNTDASEFIIKELKENPDMEIACIGPLMNIAKAIRICPDVFYGRKMYMMGGCYSQAFPEWNIQMDPYAASVVFGAGIDIFAIGLDVTLKLLLDSKEMQKLVKTTKNHVVLSQMYQIWQDNARTMPILHDALCIAAIADKSIVAYRPCHVEIETKGEYTSGVTAVTDSPFPGVIHDNPNCNVAISVDRMRFMELFWKSMGQSN